MGASKSPKGLEKQRTSQVEDFISRSLRWGVLISSVITALGLLVFLFTQKTGYPAGSFPSGLRQVLEGFMQLKPLAVIQVGLLILLATPVFWVAASVLAFCLYRDYSYALISAYVFLMLILSLLLGKAK
jgi:uncharacterized membrane protein